MGFTFYKQLDGMDCGPSCLRMVARYHGREFNLRALNKLSGFNREGISMLGLSEAAEKLGFRSLGVKLDTVDIKRAELPCILYWRQNHFVVLYKVKGGQYFIADPAVGLVELEQADFRRNWINDKENGLGVAMILAPTPDFFNQANEKKGKVKWSFILRYLVAYRKLIVQLLLGLSIGFLCVLVLRTMQWTTVTLKLVLCLLTFGLGWLPFMLFVFLTAWFKPFSYEVKRDIIVYILLNCACIWFYKLKPQQCDSTSATTNDRNP
jgi:ABC-type bacteriocin/lantibiotic exporter with double-glycine peptidase domain